MACHGVTRHVTCVLRVCYVLNVHLVNPRLQGYLSKQRQFTETYRTGRHLFAFSFCDLPVEFENLPTDRHHLIFPFIANIVFATVLNFTLACGKYWGVLVKFYIFHKVVSGCWKVHRAPFKQHKQVLPGY